MRHRCLLTLIAACCVVPSALGQHSSPAVKLATTPVIDGKIEEAEWQGAPRITEGYDEQTGAPPPPGFEQEFWLSYDEKYIYIGAKLADPEPNKILAVETRTNVSVNSEDHVVFVVDTFGSLQNLNQFRVNANGATQLQIAGGRAAKREWLGEILAAGRKTEKGWECEARIPWGVMQLPSPGKRTIRADFGRYIPRTGRAYIASNISGEQIQNIRRWVDVDVPRSNERRTIKLLPYGYAGFSNSDSEFIANSGLDLKTSLSDQLEFVGTINPDFRNIENDVLSLDFSYFERLAGESRPFFLEGQQFFFTSSDASLFASQRIGTFDAGWKTYGKISDKTQFAFLNTMDFGEQAAFATSIQHQFQARENLQVAGTMLDRNGQDNSASFLSYFKGFSRLGFFAQYSATDDWEQGQGSRFNPGFLYQGDGFNGFLEYQQISPDYIPRLGFAPKVGFKGWATSIEWTKPHAQGPLMETGLTFRGRHEDKWTGGPFLRNIMGGSSLTLRNNVDIDFEATYEEFAGFKDHFYNASVEFPRNDRYRNIGIGYAWGNVASEDLQLLGVHAAYRPLKGFQIMLRHQQLQHIEDETQTILSMNYETNRYESFSSRLLRRDDDTNIYFAWRRAGNRGIEYYVILGDPNARSFRETIILKAVVPLEIVLGRG